MHNRSGRWGWPLKRRCSGLRTLGICLMAVGALLVILFVPFEVWLALLGAVLLVTGFILIRCFS